MLQCRTKADKAVPICTQHVSTDGNRLFKLIAIAFHKLHTCSKLARVFAFMKANTLQTVGPAL